LALDRVDRPAATGASDALWAGSYRITTNAAHTALDGPVACFTIP
jgi:hypothetical protein